MTVNPSATAPDPTGPNRPPAPNLVAQGLAGAIVTALAAGPITFVFGMVILVAQGDRPFAFSIELGDLIEGTFETSKIGLIGSAPAAVVNTLLLGWLALHDRDRIAVAVASGTTLGAAIGFLACMLLASFGQGGTIEALLPTLWFALAFIATGALMGALHWRIAICPSRRWRLLQEQRRIALSAME